MSDGMTRWVNISDPKEWFRDREQFEKVKWILNFFEAQTITGKFYDKDKKGYK